MKYRKLLEMIIRSEFLLKLAFLLSCALPFVGAGNSKILDCYGAEQFDPEAQNRFNLAILRHAPGIA